MVLVPNSFVQGLQSLIVRSITTMEVDDGGEWEHFAQVEEGFVAEMNSRVTC